MWAHLFSALVGVWLMWAPAVFGYGPPLAVSDRIVGPLVVSIALIATFEVTRAVRWANVVLAVWIAVSAYLLGQPQAAFSHFLSGLAIGVLSSSRGHTKHAFAGGWRALRGS